MTGGRALAEMLQLHGVGPMFGMGGFQLLPFYEAVRASTDTPTVLDVVVTRDPARMLPGVDDRALKVEKGDRPV